MFSSFQVSSACLTFKHFFAENQLYDWQTHREVVQHAPRIILNVFKVFKFSDLQVFQNIPGSQLLSGDYIVVGPRVRAAARYTIKKCLNVSQKLGTRNVLKNFQYSCFFRYFHYFHYFHSFIHSISTC